MIRLYYSFFKVTLLEAIQFRFSLLVWLLARIIQPLIYMSVWKSVIQAKGAAVGGYTSADFAAYYIVLSVVSILTSSPFPYQISHAVETGIMSSHLLKPVNFFHGEIARSMGFRVVEAIFVTPVIILMSLWFTPNWSFSFTTLLWLFPSLILASAVRLFIEACIGTVSFWAVRIRTITEFYFLLFFFTSGQAAPMSLLPGAAKIISHYLPFRWILEFPTNLFLGRLTQAEMVEGFAFQTCWALFFFLLYNLLWKQGIKQYTAVGI